MRPITFAGRMAAAVALVLLTLTLLPQAANAATPTRLRDHTERVGCQVEDAGTKVRFAVARSDVAGTEAVAQITRDGEVISEGYAESDWSTPGSFRASVELRDDDGKVVNTAYLRGSFSRDGAGDRVLNRFKDGNIRVVEDHTTWALALADVELVVDDVTMPGVDCFGESEDGYLSYTSPASYVSRGNFLADGECVLDNATDIFLVGTVDAMYVQFSYADRPDWSASSADMNLAAGPFDGTFRLNDGNGPAGEVAATASVVRNGDVKRIGNKDGAVSERWVMTPYLLEVTAAGPDGSMRASCTFYQVEATLHVKTNQLEV